MRAKTAARTVDEAGQHRRLEPRHSRPLIDDDETDLNVQHFGCAGVPLA